MSTVTEYIITTRRAMSLIPGRPDALPMFHFSCSCGHEDNTRMAPGGLIVRAAEHETRHSK